MGPRSAANRSCSAHEPRRSASAAGGPGRRGRRASARRGHELGQECDGRHARGFPNARIPALVSLSWNAISICPRTAVLPAAAIVFIEESCFLSRRPCGARRAPVARLERGCALPLWPPSWLVTPSLLSFHPLAAVSLSASALWLSLSVLVWQDAGTACGAALSGPAANPVKIVYLPRDLLFGLGDRLYAFMAPAGLERPRHWCTGAALDARLSLRSSARGNPMDGTARGSSDRIRATGDGCCHGHTSAQLIQLGDCALAGSRRSARA